jgi:uncharacterized protein YbaR (Trm112 family)
MNNVIDFCGKKKTQEKSNQTIKTTEIVCPCTNNIFTFSCRQNTGQNYLMLQCNSCNQSYDVTEMLAEMLNQAK